MVNGVGVHWESGAGGVSVCSSHDLHTVHGTCVTVDLTLKLVDMKEFNPQILTEASMERRNSMRKAEGHVCVDRGLAEGLTHPGGSAEVRADCWDYSPQESVQHRLIGLHPPSNPRQTWAQLIARSSRKPRSRAKLCVLRCESQGPAHPANAAL